MLDIGIEPVGAPADGLHEARVLEGLDHAHLHQAGQPVAPDRALEVGHLLKLRFDQDAVALECANGVRLVDDELEGSRFRSGDGIDSRRQQIEGCRRRAASRARA